MTEIVVNFKALSLEAQTEVLSSGTKYSVSDRALCVAQPPSDRIAWLGLAWGLPSLKST